MIFVSLFARIDKPVTNKSRGENSFGMPVAVYSFEKDDEQ